MGLTKRLVPATLPLVACCLAFGWTDSTFGQKVKSELSESQRAAVKKINVASVKKNHLLPCQR